MFVTYFWTSCQFSLLFPGNQLGFWEKYWPSCVNFRNFKFRSFVSLNYCHFPSNSYHHNLQNESSLLWFSEPFICLFQIVGTTHVPFCGLRGQGQLLSRLQGLSCSTAQAGSYGGLSKYFWITICMIEWHQIGDFQGSFSSYSMKRSFHFYRKDEMDASISNAIEFIGHWVHLNPAFH